MITKTNKWSFKMAEVKADTLRMWFSNGLIGIIYKAYIIWKKMNFGILGKPPKELDLLLTEEWNERRPVGEALKWVQSSFNIVRQGDVHEPRCVRRKEKPHFGRSLDILKESPYF